MKFNHVTGSQEQKPLEVDDVSSASVVYVRKNIKQVENEDGVLLWEYDEAELTPEEYASYREQEELIRGIIDSYTGSITPEEAEELKAQIALYKEGSEAFDIITGGAE